MVCVNHFLLAASCAFIVRTVVKAEDSWDDIQVPENFRLRHHGRHGHTGRHNRGRHKSHNDVLQIDEWLDMFPSTTTPIATTTQEIPKPATYQYYTVNDTSVTRYILNPPHICIFGAVCKSAYAMKFICRCPIYQPNCVSSGKYHTARCQNSRGGRVWIQPKESLPYPDDD